MKMWKSVLLALTLVLSLFAASSTRAQTLQNGAVRGTVYDTSHSVVATAKVTLSNPATGLTRDRRSARTATTPSITFRRESTRLWRRRTASPSPP
jgi:type 1 fimbria pilin